MGAMDAISRAAERYFAKWYWGNEQLIVSPATWRLAGIIQLREEQTERRRQRRLRNRARRRKRDKR
jgi:hypothetical protein